MADDTLEIYRRDSIRMLESKDGLYQYYAPSKYPDTPLLYKELINQAETSIDIMDPYFHVQFGNPDFEDAEIFSDIKENLTIRMITEVKVNNETFFMENVEPTIKKYITEDKTCRFGMKIVKTNVISASSFHFHDRFLIIDNRDFYLVGSSIENHRIRHNSSGIYCIKESLSQEFLKDVFSYYWNNITDLEIPLRYLTY